ARKNGYPGPWGGGDGQVQLPAARREAQSRYSRESSCGVRKRGIGARSRHAPSRIASAAVKITSSQTKDRPGGAGERQSTRADVIPPTLAGCLATSLRQRTRGFRHLQCAAGPHGPRALSKRG